MLFCAALSIEKAIDLPKKEPLVGRYIIPSETAKRKRENSWRDRYQKKMCIRDSANYGTRSIESAFAVSSNTGFAELCTEIGPDKVADMAHKCGIESDLESVPSITLGVEEVSVLEMAQAYATIANGGTLHKANCIEEIKDSSGQVIYHADTRGDKVLNTDLTQAAVEVMEGVVQKLSLIHIFSSRTFNGEEKQPVNRVNRRA